MRQSLFCCGLLYMFWALVMSHRVLGKARACAPSDLAALRAFAASFPSANFSDWEASDDCCAWGASVTCSAAPYFPPNSTSSSHTHASVGVGRSVVTKLHLDDVASRNMSNYPIPTSICRLSSLTSLILSGGLSGSIPPCIGINLSSLIYLSLSFNRLTGSIPPLLFSTLHSLHSLDLSDNFLSGPLPPFNSTPLLQSIHLSGNSFSGPLPSFNGTPFLQSLDLSVNSFSAGPVPSFHSTPLLQSLHLSENSLSGPLPSFNSTPLLQSLRLSDNSLSGPLPSFNSTPLLQSLDLSYNSFSAGPLPSFHSTPFLQALHLSGNSFSGPLPSFNSTPFLQSLHLPSNSFSGPLPSFCEIASLTDLFLGFNSLSGGLSLFDHRGFNATQLTFLIVDSNHFSGPFPEWIGSLSNLEGLDLSYNSFNGPLPSSWQNLSRLSHLGLSGNSLLAPYAGAPKLPSWVSTIIFSLRSVSLSSLQLQDADLHCSSSLHNMFNHTWSLEYLDFSNNNFSSDIVLLCLSSYNITDLYEMYISKNPLRLNLSHSDTVKLLPRPVYMLDMSSCKLTGRLTSLFFNQLGSSIINLYLANNDLVGEVPAELGNLSYLSELDLSSNHFTGFASLLQKLSKVEVLHLSHNSLTGDFSSLLLNILNISTCNLPSGIAMVSLDVSNNFLTGIIPPFLGQCLFYSKSFPIGLKLNDNRLTGSIPNELFGKNHSISLRILSLGNNSLSGYIPPFFKNLKHLVLLDLSHNNFRGKLESIPLFRDASPGQYSSLRVLLLGYNGFTGSVPAALGNIAPALQLIDFSNNHLTGPIPVHTLQTLSAFRNTNSTSRNSALSAVNGTFFNVEFKININGNQQPYGYVLQALTMIDFSSNNLSGTISEGLGELSGLVYLNLSRNRLSGLIPSDIGKIGGQLESLDLSVNELVGGIPANFRNFTMLAVFNVSFNPGLSGPIPLNQPQFECQGSYIGDGNLCGEPILPSCSEGHDASPQHSDEEAGLLENKSHGFADVFNEWISLPAVCLGIVVGFLGTLYAIVVFL